MPLIPASARAAAPPKANTSQKRAQTAQLADADDGPRPPLPDAENALAMVLLSRVWQTVHGLDANGTKQVPTQAPPPAVRPPPQVRSSGHGRVIGHRMRPLGDGLTSGVPPESVTPVHEQQFRQLDAAGTPE